jgi:DNA-binding transcriptional regulator YiaG
MMNADKMTPEEFKKIRGEKTQAEFADILGIAQPRVSGYESGDRPIKKYIIRLIRCLQRAGEI